jgi:hypothetical protein
VRSATHASCSFLRRQDQWRYRRREVQALLGEIDARGVDSITPRNGVNCRRFSYIFHHGQKRFSVNCFAEEGKSEHYEPIFQKMAESIVSKDPKPGGGSI